jgi:hypothetical protein
MDSGVTDRRWSDLTLLANKWINAHLQPSCHGINGIKEVRSEVYVERKH